MTKPVARRIALLFLLVILAMPIAPNVAAAQDGQPPIAGGERPDQSFAPPFMLPAKTSFTTREGESFITVITATCPGVGESDTQFEVLAPTPGFVHISSAYKGVNEKNDYTEGIGVVEVSPQVGDAGKHTVSIRVKSCNGAVERTITFKVRVKPAEF